MVDRHQRQEIGNGREKVVAYRLEVDHQVRTDCKRANDVVDGLHDPYVWISTRTAVSIRCVRTTYR